MRIIEKKVVEKRPMAIEDCENICFKCLNEFEGGDLKRMKISSMGYGSGFDGWSTEVHLCDECIKETNLEWWKLEVIDLDKEGWVQSYKYEGEIFGYIKTLPIEGQELFWNRYSTDNYSMDSQDWIDYELDLLSHEKCKEYGMYSPQEIKAYNERFPICNRVELKVYGDGSSHCKCFLGAFGESDGSVSKNNYSTTCYECTHFALREGEILTVDLEEEEVKRIKEQIAILHKKLQELEK